MTDFLMSYSNSFLSFEFWKPFLHDSGGLFPESKFARGRMSPGTPTAAAGLKPQLHSSPPSSVVHSRFPFTCLGDLRLSGCGYCTCLIIANIGIKRPLCGLVR